MVVRASAARVEPAASLSVLDRLAPPPPRDVVAGRIEALTAPGDVVVDLHARGGWIARVAVDEQRRAISLESSPLTRLLAELVLRPPDLRHLDAAFQAIAAAPLTDTSLRLWIGQRFTTRCSTCERSLIFDELVWEATDDGPPRPVARHYRCQVCRAQRGRSEGRNEPVDEADVALARGDGGEEAAAVRRTIRDRFPAPDGDDQLVDELLDLHTPRQLLGLAAILDRIGGDLRAAPVEAALRIALLGAVLPASRLYAYPGRLGALRVHAGRLRATSPGAWRERNPWLAFEDGYRHVRTFVQRLEGGAHGPLAARFGDDLRALLDGTAVASVRVGTPSVFRGLAHEAADAARAVGPIGARLVLAQPPLRPSTDRIALAYYLTGWTLGREAASLLPLDALFGSGGRAPWGWQSRALTRSLDAAAPMLSRDGRAVLVCEPGGNEALIAAVLGGVGAGYRLAAVRSAGPGEEAALVELVPPGASLPPGPRTRANVVLPPVPGGAGDPDLLPRRRLFAPPERFEPRPFSEREAARTITESAVEVLKARGEPAGTDRLLGEILVGLDRAGHLRRLVTAGAGAGAARAGGAAGGAAGAGGAARADDRVGSDTHDRGRPDTVDHRPGDRTTSGGEPSERLGLRDRPSGLRGRPIAEPGAAAPRGAAAADLWSRRPPGPEQEATGQVERLLGLIHEELGRPDQRRLVEIEPDRWWLAERTDREAAAVPLADRVEWAVFSLLSTAGPLSEGAFLDRIAGLFTGHDLPDETLVRTCLESYRSMASTADRLTTGDDLLRRTEEHTELLALLAELGHRLGLAVWLGRREHERRVGGHRLDEWLDERERRVHLPTVLRAPADALAECDAIWYVRGRATILFEVEWTAMLSEPVLRRHGRIPGDERTVRLLVIAPERTELVRHKLDRSPLLRAALEAGNWHILKSHHLRSFAALETPTLEALEPLVGLDPVVERGGEQLPLFGS